MSSPRFGLRQHSKSLGLSQPIINILHSISEISKLPTFKSKLRGYYKRFYKLRNFECTPRLFQHEDFTQTRDEVTPIEYIALIRRTFRKVDYNLKREKFLSLPPLDDAELEKRIQNTLAFVFNHTVELQNPHADELVVTKKDEERTAFDTMESKILSTILKMDMIAPANIKYDFKFAWLDDLNEKAKLARKGKKDPFTYKDEFPINYKMYLTTLMRMNESLQLCF